MIKVCHMSSAHNRYDVRILEKECVTLTNNDYDVTFLVNDNKNDEVYKGVKIISTGYLPKSKIKRMVISKRMFLKKALEIDAQIYHFHDPELLSIGLKLLKKNKNVVFDSHEYYYEQIKHKNYLPKYFRKIIANLYLRYETRVVSKLDAVIFPCTLKGGINPFQGRAKNTVYINNVPKLNEFYNHYKNNKRNNMKYKMCNVGSLTYNRGVLHDIQASYRSKTTLILAGKFTPQKLKDEVESLCEYEYVDYRGYVNRDEVLNIYQESDIGICTLLDKGQYFQIDTLPTKVYEYMSMGLPVIISDTPYANEILKEYKFGLTVNPEDIDEIANAIAYLRNNPKTAKEMGDNGRRAIIEKYNWDIEEKKLVKLYNDLSK